MQSLGRAPGSPGCRPAPEERILVSIVVGVDPLDHGHVVHVTFQMHDVRTLGEDRVHQLRSVTGDEHGDVPFAVGVQDRKVSAIDMQCADRSGRSSPEGDITGDEHGDVPFAVGVQDRKVSAIDIRCADRSGRSNPEGDVDHPVGRLQ